ncbi:hypothetical protein GLAREA_05053 [Glarea lozoyensis ATCC 20868]|uniref:Uncharacterized protein n=1 Tax=Glarea lozoyensis (strain ATCC 20868 / MF5171) TaxID=1116229 RepID=S3DUU3_GLAL2|nr:uncharacterized protein GLAREA_05053 [Glarea lozoyensis ATCC 20868]EPE35716.1 hypothetical protein GLAREA_05053 [Glarea lozoyensis ATCC 20868]
MPSRPDAPRRVKKKPPQKTHLNAPADPRNEGRVNDIREFQYDILEDIEEAEEQQARENRLAKGKEYSVKVAKTWSGPQISITGRLPNPNRKRELALEHLQNYRNLSKRSKSIRQQEKDREAIRKSEADRAEIKKLAPNLKASNSVAEVKYGEFQEPPQPFDNITIKDLANIPSIEASWKERDVAKWRKEMGIAHKKGHIPTAPVFFDAERDSVARTDVDVYIPTQYSRMVDTITTAEKHELSKPLAMGLSIRYSYNPAKEGATRQPSLRYLLQSPENQISSPTQGHSSDSHPKVLLPITHNPHAAPKVDSDGEPSGYSAHIKEPDYYLSSKGWWHRATASADPIITFTLTWDFSRNTTDVPALLGTTYTAYEAHYNNANPVTYTTTIGVFDLPHLLNAIRSEFNLKEAEPGDYALEVREFLVTFHYRNGFGGESEMFVCQEGDKKGKGKGDRWREVRAAFCLPFTERGSFGFRFGVERGGLVES